MRFAPGAWSFGLPPLVAGVALVALLPASWWAGALLVLVGVGVVLFHRDPDRLIGPGIVAPSDGLVAEAAQGPGGGFIGTFLNVHNVHVVRAPADATVAEVRRLQGPFKPAWAKDARKNAGVELRLDTPHGEVRVRMLVGFVARRVIPYVKPQQRIAKGERIGLIRFGSRVELVLPPAAKVVVAAGAATKAGTTTVAEVPT